MREYPYRGPSLFHELEIRESQALIEAETQLLNTDLTDLTD
jgi:hypothetical protein